MVTASGMGALTVLTQLLSPGDTIIAPHDCYGGTYRLFEQQSQKGLFDVEFVDQTELETLRRVVRSRPRIILTETPSNPLLRIVDLEAIRRNRQRLRCAVCRRQYLPVAGIAESDRVRCRPGYSLNHQVHQRSQRRCRWLRGCRNDELAEQCAYWANVIGITGAPFRQLPDAARDSHAASANPAARRKRDLIATCLNEQMNVRRFTTRDSKSIPDTRLRNASNADLAGWSVLKLMVAKRQSRIRREPAVFLAGRVAWRRGEPCLPSGLHDARTGFGRSAKPPLA